MSGKDNLKDQTARGSIIMVGVVALLRPITLVSTFFLARLLDPEHFGAVALALVLLNTSSLFSSLGMDAALIQTRLERKEAAFHGFVITMVTSLLFFAVIYRNAGFLAEFLLGDAELTSILSWLSFLILLNGLMLAPLAYLRRDLKFGRSGSISLFTEVIYFAFAVPFAFSDLGVWSLVYARLISSGLKTMLAWVLCPGWDWIVPRRLDMTVTKELVSFGTQNTLSGLVSYFHTNWDDWFIGRQFGKAQLGFYTRAYDLTNKTIGKLGTSVVSGVFFPSYAKMQNEPKRLARAYLKSLRLIMLIMFPVALGILAIPFDIVIVLLGPKWLPMIPTLQIYAFLVLTRPISENTAPLFKAMGKPSYNTKAGLLLLLVTLPLAYFLLGLEITGIAFAVVAGHVAGVLYNVYQVNTLLPGTARETAVSIWPALFSSIAMAAGVRALRPLVLSLLDISQANMIGLFVLVSFGVLIYAAASFVLQRALLQEITKVLLGFVERTSIGKRFLRQPVPEVPLS